MSLHLQKFNCEYLVRYIVYLSKIIMVGTGPLAKIQLRITTKFLIGKIYDLRKLAPTR